MKKLQYLLIAIYFIISSCSQVDDFIETILLENASDSTTVTENDDNDLEKPTQNNEGTIGDWELHGGTKIDNDKSGDNEEGSIKLSKTSKTWQGSDRIVFKKKVPVSPGKTYEIKYKLYSETWPPPTIHVTGEFHNSKKRLFNSEGSHYSNSSVNSWENNSLIITVPNNTDIKYIVPKLSMLPKYGRNDDIWIDQIRVNEIDVNQIKIIDNKKKFDGSLTRVDKHGNIEIFRDGIWRPFFLFGIYADKARNEWKTYSNQGFNTNMWASDAQSIKRGENADLYSNLQIGQYVVDVDWLPKDKKEKIKIMGRTINQIKNAGLMQEIIFYYIDNEFYDIPEQLIEVSNSVIELDKDKYGERMHPIYMLNGAFGLARKYNNIIDITGTYVAQDRTNNPLPNNFTGLQISENQNLPAVVAQINRGVGLNFRPILFGAIAKGAKGMGFWRDGGSGIDIEKAKWWNDFPNMANEIEQMLPLIREPHFTDWIVKCDNDDIIYGSRNYKGKGHLILANPTNKQITTVIDINDLTYEFNWVKDYFTKEIVGNVDGDNLILSIEPHGSKVVYLD